MYVELRVAAVAGVAADAAADAAAVAAATATATTARFEYDTLLPISEI